MYHLKTCILIFLGLIIAQANCQTVDETLTPLSKGADVAEAVVRKIQRSGVFPHDQNLLRRIAFVETRDGEDPITYRPEYFGGIWQMSEDRFEATQNITFMNDIYRRINDTWNIQWNSVTWNDLLKPFYSGLGVRIHLHRLTQMGMPLPGTIDNQAEYWRYNYHRGNKTMDDYKNLVRVLESDGGVCQGLLDICIVLDGSGSIGDVPFVQAKGFVADLVATFSLNSTRVAFTLYSDNAQNIFDFNNTLTAAEMGNVIRDVRYPSQDTNTPAGLNMAVYMFGSATPRPGVPKVVATFTDGKHNQGNLPAAVNAVRRANLTSFAVGIGNQNDIDDSELQQIALGDPSKVFRVTDYAALAEFFYQMNKVTCEVPQEPELGQDQSGTLINNEKRYFKYEVPDEGITVTLSGDVSGYYSHTEPTPNSALHDGDLSGPKFIRNPSNDSIVYVAVQGKAGTNSTYTLKTEQGDHLSGMGAKALINPILWLGVAILSFNFYY